LCAATCNVAKYETSVKEALRDRGDVEGGPEARDLEQFVELFGFQPWEPLRGTGVHVGKASAGASSEKLGQFKEGFFADILLIDGYPLNDLNLLQYRNSILSIMKDGHVWNGPWIQERHYKNLVLILIVARHGANLCAIAVLRDRLD
jgi:hypothetical protein